MSGSRVNDHLLRFIYKYNITVLINYVERNILRNYCYVFWFTYTHLYIVAALKFIAAFNGFTIYFYQTIFYLFLNK